MKIIIAYPPLDTSKGTPLLSQNRQFQYFKEPTYIYPVVPAQAATLLKGDGFDVVWLDCIAQNYSYEQFLSSIEREKADLIVFETKTPVVKQHWGIINDLKSKFPELKTVLVGDHVTALPLESFQNCKVDFVLTGGDYDFLILNLCNHLKQPKIELEAGIWFRENANIKNTGQFKLDHNLNSLPFIDRELTKWQLYAYKNGNYKKTPGTYIMSGRDCWWGKCTFCAWPQLYPEFRARSTGNVLNEIEHLIEKYNVCEIMDDTGTFPVGDWLHNFCNGMISRDFDKKISIDCNMRFGCLDREDFKLMKRAGFRLLLFGIESANQHTLNKLNKNVKIEEITEGCKLARSEGLYPHITIMFGYPWESYDDAVNTLNLGRWLLKKGYAHTVQATLVIPYPGTALFEECSRSSTLKTLDWDYYDMKDPVMKVPMDEIELKKLVQGIYSVAFNPEFIYNRIKSITDFDDVLYFARAGKKVFGHIKDFSANALRKK